MTAFPTPGNPSSPNTQDETLKRFQDLLREGQETRMDFEEQWDTNLKRYVGVHWEAEPPKGLRHFTNNRIQTAIIANVAVQAEQRPRVELRPVETGEPATVYLSSNGAAKAAQLQIPMTEGQLQSKEPLSAEEVAALMAIPNPMPDPMAIPGSPPLPYFNTEDFIGITDKTATEATQTAVDIMMDRSCFDSHLIENVTNKTIVGHQATLVQWNDYTRMPELVTVHPRNCWIDPTATDMQTAEWFILATVMSANKAVGMFPKHKAAIRQAATEGQQDNRSVASGGGQLGQPYTNTDFGRDMVTIYTMWERSHPFPMSVEEAVASGAVRVLKLEEGIETYVTDDANGKPVETEEGDELWPSKPGILQSRILNEDMVLEEIECPYDTIPVAWNINLPIPFRPYGMGEPERLEDMQQLINRIMSIMHNHYRYFQSPQNVMAQSMVQAMEDQKEPFHSHPGRTVTVPDDLYIAMRGRVKTSEDAPTFPQAAVNALTLAISEFKELSGYTDVMQGKPHSGAESGRAILALQTAARGTIGYKSMLTEKYVREVVRLYVCILRDYMTPDDWKKMVSKYPIEVLTALQARMKDIDFDISVEIVSGRGVTREMARNNAIQEYQLGLETLDGVLSRIETSNPKEKALQILRERGMLTQSNAAGVPQQAGQNGSDQQTTPMEQAGQVQ